MKSNSFKTKAIVLAPAILAAAAIVITRGGQQKASVEVQETHAAESPKQPAQLEDKITQPARSIAVEKPRAQALGPKMKLNLSALVKANPQIKDLNPGVDFNALSFDDSRIKNIRLPKDTRLAVVKDPLCTKSSISSLGESSSDAIMDAADTSRAPSVIGFTTDREQTLGELDKNVGSNDCVLGIVSNGSLSSVSLPNNTRDLVSLVPQGTQAPVLYDYAQLVSQGTKIVMKSITEGDPQKAQIYLAGMTVAGSNYDSQGSDQPLAVEGIPVPGNAANIYVYPISTTSADNQVAQLNNQIIVSVTRGAHFVIVPLVNPQAILPAIQYATSQGVQVVMMPQGTRLPGAGAQSGGNT